MPGYSGVLQRQLEDESATRNFVQERLRRQVERHEAAIKASAKVFLSELKKLQPQGKKQDVQRDKNSSRTKQILVRLVNETPTKGRIRYFLTGEGDILWKGQFDTFLRVFDIRETPLEEHYELAELFGVDLHKAN